jgi:hypothetical protein
MPGWATCATVSGTEQEKWRQIYGTENYGNLPKYKKSQHVGHKYAPCPFSTQCDDLRTRIMLRDYVYEQSGNTSDLLAMNNDGSFLIPDSLIDPTLISILGYGRIDHTDIKIHYMKTSARSAKWGFECTFMNCSYRTAVGRPYVYI